MDDAQDAEKRFFFTIFFFMAFLSVNTYFLLDLQPTSRIGDITQLAGLTHTSFFPSFFACGF